MARRSAHPARRPSNGLRATFAAVSAAAWLVTVLPGQQPGWLTEPTAINSESVTSERESNSRSAGADEDPATPTPASPTPAETRTAARVVTSGNRATLVAHVVGDGIVAYGGPASSRVVGSFASPNRHGTPLVFQSIAEPDSALIETGWIPVLLPMRPNGTVGWIRTDEVELTRNPYRIEVDVDDFILTVYRSDEVHFRTTVGIGEGDTPTPYGSFYLTDLVGRRTRAASTARSRTVFRGSANH